MAAPTQNRARTAVVLSGGGARGAYEAGVIAGVVEILRDQARDVQQRAEEVLSFFGT